MPTVIDSLLVELSLDTSKFQAGERDAKARLAAIKAAFGEIDAGNIEGRKATERQFKRTSDSANATAKDLEASGKRAAQFFGELQGGALRFFTILAGGTGVTQFLKFLADSEIASDRFAKNLSMGTEEVSAWEGAIKKVGGSSEDARSALKGMADLVQNIRMGTEAGAEARGLLNSMGLTGEDMKDPSSMLLGLARASKNMTADDFRWRAEQLGISPSMITLLREGEDKVRSLVTAQREAFVATREHAEELEKLQTKLSQAGDAVSAFGADLLHDAVPALDAVANSVMGLFNQLDRLEKLHDQGQNAVDWSRLPNWLGGDGGLWFRPGPLLTPGATSPKDSPFEDWFPSSSTSAPASPGTDAAFDALIYRESRGQQFDRNGKPLESTIYRNGKRVPGAIGVAQIMDGTGPEAAALAGLPWDRNRWLNDRDYNMALGRAYFGAQMTRFGGDTKKAWGAYNAGPGRVGNAVSRYGADWLAHMPKETQDYVASNLSRMPALGVGAAGGAPPSITTGPITIHTQATDAKGIATDLVGAIHGAAQANRGLY